MIFSQQQLDEYVSKALPELPEGHTSGVVGFVDEQGIKVAALVSLEDGLLKAKVAVEHDWNGDNKFGASILASW